MSIEQDMTQAAMDEDEYVYLNRLTKSVRASTIEECARELERLMRREDLDVIDWPTAIRALKDSHEAD